MPLDDEVRTALLDACAAHQLNLSALVVVSRLLSIPEVAAINPSGDSDASQAVMAARRWVERATRVGGI